MFKVPHHLLAVCVLAAPAFAEEPLQTPTGEVLLTVTGAIEKTNTDGAALFVQRGISCGVSFDQSNVTPIPGTSGATAR